MNDERIGMIMRYAKGGKPQRVNYVLREIQENPDGSKTVVSESPLPIIVGRDVHMILMDSAFTCAASEQEVIELEHLNI